MEMHWCHTGDVSTFIQSIFDFTSDQYSIPRTNMEFTLDYMDFTLDNMDFTLDNMDFTLDNMDFTLDNMDFTLDNMDFTLDNMDFTLDNMTYMALDLAVLSTSDMWGDFNQPKGKF